MYCLFLKKTSFVFTSFYLQIRDFHIAKREEDIVYYSGYVGELFLYLNKFHVERVHP